MKTILFSVLFAVVFPAAWFAAELSDGTTKGVGADPLLKRFDKDGDVERAAIRELTRKRAQQPGSMAPSGKTETVGNRKVRERMANLPVPGNLTRRTLKVGEVEREFFIHIPEQCKGKPAPVVFALHGGAGSSGLEMHHKADFTEVGTREGFVTVYPSGINGWNAGLQNFAAMRNKGADDTGFFRAMFDTLVAERIADEKRLYLAGGSNGGLMAQYLMCKIPGRIAAAGILVATLPRKRDWPAPSQPVPVMLMLGTKDPRKTWDGDRHSLSAEDTVRFWREVNQCVAESKKWDLPDRDPNDGCRVHAQRWEGKAPVVFYTLEGHGHGWPMQEVREETGTGPKTHDIAAPEEFWQFFQSTPSTKLAESKPMQQTDTRIKPTASQSAAIRKLREKTANMPVPENLTRRTLTVGGKEREFFINILAACKGKPAPVVFALHGGASSSGLAQHLKVDYAKLGEQEGYVTVYPSGVNGWNIGSHDSYSVKRRTSDADDIGFFRAMFDTLIKEGVADPKRIYVTGGSNGGVMTQFLVCHLADRIAGAGVVVATLPRVAEKDWPKPSRPVPVLVMLGTKDPMKPWNGNADQMSADETIAFWRQQNGCAADGKKWDLPDRDPNDGCRVHAQRWEGKAPVVFYTMEGHGHGWPMQKGRDATDTGSKTRDISAPEEFWTFFKASIR